MSGLRPPKLHPPPNPNKHRVRKGRIKSVELERRRFAPQADRQFSSERHSDKDESFHSSDSQLSDVSDMSGEVRDVNLSKDHNAAF